MYGHVVLQCSVSDCCGVHCLPLQLHTSDLGDGYDWNKVNLRSVTEESRLDEFLRTAQLAGTEFTAGRRTPLESPIPRLHWS